MNIKQIREEDVLNTLCENFTVYRFNVENGTSKDLTKMTIKAITKDFNDAKFLYFILSE